MPATLQQQQPLVACSFVTGNPPARQVPPPFLTDARCETGGALSGPVCCRHPHGRSKARLPVPPWPPCVHVLPDVLPRVCKQIPSVPSRPTHPTGAVCTSSPACPSTLSCPLPPAPTTVPRLAHVHAGRLWARQVHPRGGHAEPARRRAVQPQAGQHARRAVAGHGHGRDERRRRDGGAGGAARGCAAR
eukprot:360114-Chlamydomonas_euryale.AAC.4